MNKELSANTTLSHYRIVSKIGAGAMGEVYLAEDTRLDRKVALKLLPAEFTDNSERVRRFMQEAKAASALNHPNIITVYDIGEEEAGRFIVMELVAGRTLRDAIAEYSSVNTVLTLGRQLAGALDAAHAAGITHRDIKPDNIMVRDDGYVKILDFGVARLVPTTASDGEAATLAQQTAPGTLFGTVAYMSPEQARGQAISPASDIFSLGIVLSELATGKHPFKADTLVGYLHAIALQTPAPMTSLRPELPAALDDLLLRMLEKEASKRPTANEVAQALQQLERLSDPESEDKGETLLISPLRSGTSPTLRHTVGREQERKELRAAFDITKGGRGVLICVAGEPGIGKTTLVEDFLAETAAENQYTIARGRCSERLAGTEAYLPLLEALDSLLHDEPARAVTMRQLAPTWYAQVASISSDDAETQSLLEEVRAASQERTKRELAAFVQTVAQVQPLVIFFDDLHWADVSTIDLLSFLASKFDALNVLIVVTYRPSDMLLAKHPFLQIKPDLQARGLCRELQLEFLREDEIAAYLELEFPGHCFPAQFPALIHAKTEGSPLFMADLVRYLSDRDVIAQASGSQDGEWTLAQALPDLERELPESVRGMIERKIAQLAEEDHKLLTAASVQGYEFDSAVVAQVLGIDADEAEERLERLERVYAFVRLVSESEFPNRVPTLTYRFVHVLYQNALYGDLRATRKATISREMAQTMEDLYSDRHADVANELALLWEAGRAYGRAADCFLLAARDAAQAFAHHEAAALGYRGLEMLKHLPDSRDRVQKELDLQLVLGPAVMVTKGWAAPELETIYSAARKNCDVLGETKQMFPVLTGLWNFYLLHADYRSARNLGEDLLGLAQKAQDPALLVAAHWALVESSFWTADFEFARHHIQQVVSLYDFNRDRSLAFIYGQDPWVICRAYDAVRLLLLGYPQQALNTIEEIIARAHELEHPFDVGMALFWAAKIHLIRREPLDALERATALAALSEEHGFAFFQPIAGTFRGWALCEQGEIGDGIAEMKIGLTAFRATGTEVYGGFLEALLAEALGKAGRVAEGTNLINEAIRFAASKNERFYEPELYRLKGELLLIEGATVPDVESCFQQAIEIARRLGAKYLELRAVMSLARLWQHHGKRTEAQQILQEIYGWFAEGFDTADLKEAKAMLN